MVGTRLALIAVLITSMLLSGCHRGTVKARPTGGSSTTSTNHVVSGGFHTVSDDSGALMITVPAAWRAQPSPWRLQNGVVGNPGLRAGPDPALLGQSWAVGGVFLGASKELAKRLGIVGVGFSTALFRLAEWHGKLDSYESECKRQGASSYEKSNYTGFVTRWTDCGGIGTTFLDLAAMPEDGSFIVVVHVTARTAGDLQSAKQLLGSFKVHGDRLP
jgi:serine protease Do